MNLRKYQRIVKGFPPPFSKKNPLWKRGDNEVRRMDGLGFLIGMVDALTFLADNFQGDAGLKTAFNGYFGFFGQ